MADPTRDPITDLLDRGLCAEPATPPPARYLAAVRSIRRRNILVRTTGVLALAASIALAAVLFRNSTPRPADAVNPVAPSANLIAKATSPNALSVGALLALNQGRSPSDIILPGEFHGMGNAAEGDFSAPRSTPRLR